MQPKIKQELRERVQSLLKKQSRQKRLENSRKIKNRILAMPEFKEAKSIMFYASLDGEVETFEMMKLAKKLGKRIILPKINILRKKMTPVLVKLLNNDLTDGPFGIKEPKIVSKMVVPLKKIDLVLVPALAFDRKNHRLGRGGGYYDRFLSKLSDRTRIIGLAFKFQIVSSIPHPKAHDVCMHRVVTN